MSFAARSTAIVLVFLGLITWALERSFSYGQVYGRPVEALEVADHRLIEHVLQARAGSGAAEAELDADARALRLASLRLTSQRGPLRRDLAEIGSAVARTGRAVGRFRRAYADLHAALDGLGRAEGSLSGPGSDPALDRVALAVAAAAVRLAGGDAEGARGLRGSLEALRRPRYAARAGARELRRAVGILAPAAAEADGAVAELEAVAEHSIRPAGRRALAALHAEREAAERRRRFVDATLYAGSLAVLLLLLRALARQRRDGEALRWTLMKERLAFETSGLFIACPPEQVDERIETMLRMLCEGYGAERVYLLHLDGSRRAVTWGRPPAGTGWPAALFDYAPEIEALPVDAFRQPYDGMPLSPRLLGALAANGVEVWSCAKVYDGRGLSALLGFDRSTAIPVSARSTLDNLLLHANVVYNALLRQRLFAKRMELEARLRRAERLEAIGTFTTGVAHNFNNLVGAIAGQAEMAVGLLPPSHGAAAHVRRLLRTTSRAQRVAGQILEFGRVGGGSKREVDAVALLEETAACVTATADAEGVSIELQPHEGPAYVRADPGLLQQVFHNVVLNAVQASSRPSKVEIGAVEVDSPGRVATTGRLRAARYVRVRVSDCGRGMDEATLSRLFEPFFTTRPSGTGLGLATAMETLREMDGGIDVESSPGRGTRMWLWLPAATEADRSEPAADATVPTVLLVNGDREALLRDEEILAMLGFEPVGFACFDDVLVALERDQRRFDLLLVEATPGTAARSFLRTARDRLYGPRRIVLSGNGADASEMAALGVHACIGRPWRPALVAATLREAMRPGSAPD